MKRWLGVAAFLVACNGDTAGADLATDDLAVPDDLSDAAVPRDFATAPRDAALPVDLAFVTCTPSLLAHDAGFSRSVFLAAIGASQELLTAVYDPSDGWCWFPAQTTPAIVDVALIPLGGTPFLVARQSDTTLSWSRFDPTTATFPPLQPIAPGVQADAPPGVAYNQSIQVEVWYQYAGAWSFVRYIDGAGWSAPMVEQGTPASALSPAPYFAQGAFRAVVTGTDGTLYDVATNPGFPVTVTPLSASLTSALSPGNGAGIVFVDPDGGVGYGFTSFPGWPKYPSICAASAACRANPTLPPTWAGSNTGSPNITFWAGAAGGVYYAYDFPNGPVVGVAAPTSESCRYEPAGAQNEVIGYGAIEVVYVRQDGALRHVHNLAGLATWPTPNTVAAPAIASPPRLSAAHP